MRNQTYTRGGFGDNTSDFVLIGSLGIIGVIGTGTWLTGPALDQRWLPVSFPAADAVKVLEGAADQLAVQTMGADRTTAPGETDGQFWPVTTRIGMVTSSRCPEPFSRVLRKNDEGGSPKRDSPPCLLVHCFQRGCTGWPSTICRCRW